MSPAQLTRLVARHAETGTVVDLRARNNKQPFETRYRPINIRLLAEVDEAFGQMSGLATCEILRRAFEVHGDPRFERLASISRSHVYNLRGSRTYRAKRTTWTKTKGSNAAIAVRKAPEPNGAPDFLRVDSVHQGADRDGVKGVYIVNPVDEVTQYEYVGVVRGISEYLRDDVKTPHEKLKSLSGAAGHLKPGLTFRALDRIAGAQSDLEAAPRIEPLPPPRQTRP